MVLDLRAQPFSLHRASQQKPLDMLYDWDLVMVDFDGIFRRCQH